MSMSYEEALRLGIVEPPPQPDPAVQAEHRAKLDALAAKVRELEDELGEQPELTPAERVAKVRRLMQKHGDA